MVQYRRMKLILAQIMLVVLLSIPHRALAAEVLGIHILSPDELEFATELYEIEGKGDTWNYVTVPITLDDLEKREMWQRFFNLSRSKKVRPIVRLATKFEA